jgi:2-amino-4-hydroxy-6-hydroxymethyldihydropteridine diphosphokinase
MNTAYLLIGGNIGDRERNLRETIAAISATAGVVAAVSHVYETEAWGRTDQPAFLNQALELQTNYAPEALLRLLIGIEESLGRKRQQKYDPRTIDIDIIFYNDLVMRTPELEVPHPRMAERRFVLAPLAELAPDKVHPVLHATVEQILSACTDPLAVNKIN